MFYNDQIYHPNEFDNGKTIEKMLKYEYFQL